jgi:hypothetical protein
MTPRRLRIKSATAPVAADRATMGDCNYIVYYDGKCEFIYDSRFADMRYRRNAVKGAILFRRVSDFEEL